MTAGPYEKTVTVTVAIGEPALSPLRSVLRAALDLSLQAVRDPSNAPGLHVASRPGETAEQYAARAVERTRYLVDQFGANRDPAGVVTAPRSMLLAAVDAALQEPHPSPALRALIDLRRTVMNAEEDSR